MKIHQSLFALFLLVLPLSLRANEFAGNNCEDACGMVKALQSLNCGVLQSEARSNCFQEFLRCSDEDFSGSVLERSSIKTSRCAERYQQCYEEADEQGRICLDIAEYDYIHCLATCTPHHENR